jgi:hypothetical protein
MACRPFTPGAINQNPTHRLSRRAKKMRPTFPALTLATDPQPRFMNQRRRLQRLSRRFTRHLLRSHATQFRINQGKKLIGRDVAFPAEPIEQLGEIVRAVHITAQKLRTNAARRQFRFSVFVFVE